MNSLQSEFSFTLLFTVLVIYIPLSLTYLSFVNLYSSYTCFLSPFNISSFLLSLPTFLFSFFLALIIFPTLLLSPSLSLSLSLLFFLFFLSLFLSLLSLSIILAFLSTSLSLSFLSLSLSFLFLYFLSLPFYFLLSISFSVIVYLSLSIYIYRESSGLLLYLYVCNLTWKHRRGRKRRMRQIVFSRLRRG